MIQDPSGEQPQNNALDKQNNNSSIEESTSSLKPQLSPAPKRFKKVLIIALLLAIFVSIGVAVFYQYEITHKTQSENISQVSNAEKPNSEQVEFTTKQYLLKVNQTYNGATIGYVKKKATSSRNNHLIKKAYAEEMNDYKTGVFYQAQDGELYILDTDTKNSNKITDGGGSNPKFSSVSQQLAYLAGGCQLVLKNLNTDEITIADKNNSGVIPQSTGKCFEPLIWSPDGRNLAYAIYEDSDPALGLVRIAKLSLYNIETKKISSI